jgi:SRSO17 transposase
MGCLLHNAAILGRVRDWVQPTLGVESGCYWILDDTGFPKKGKHSVGVARQYCGQLGKQDNCQVAVSLSLASVQGSLPIAYQLYLPKDWATDPGRRKKAGVPADMVFATKPEIALAQLRQAVAAGVPMGIVLADAGYGDETAFRDGIAELGILYAVGIRPATTVWAPGTAPLPPKPWSGHGIRPTRLRREPGHEPVAVKNAGYGIAPRSLPPGHLAGGYQYRPVLPFRRAARSSCSPGLPRYRDASRGMAVDRMA